MYAGNAYWGNFTLVDIMESNLNSLAYNFGKHAVTMILLSFVMLVLKIKYK